MPLAIEDYALIGSTLSAALVGRDGSIDWLCLPRFDSPACFAALLGRADNGRWLIAPAETPRSTSRRYVEDTLVLETRFEVASGVAVLTDFMPLPQEGRPLELIRMVRCERGAVAMKTELVLRFDYGSVVPWVSRRPEGLRAIAGPDALLLRTPIELEGRERTTAAEFTIKEGQTIPFTLTWYPSHLPPPAPTDPDALLAETSAFWRDWSQRCTTAGEWRSAVVRSLITLKALTYSPTGGIVAAPTTSLPERIGGMRNWDYRYCWLRDATFTLYALDHSGYAEEALAWRDWLLRAVAGDPAQMQIMYGLAGERRLDEYELPWLDGHEGSRPVRVGNAAHHQRQTDVYGEVMDALYLGAHGGSTKSIRAELRGVQEALIEFLEGHWHEPDCGIWEVRRAPRRYTHSAVMAWVALDRAIKSAREFGIRGPVRRWRQLRAQIHDDVCRQGIDPAHGRFAQYFGGEALDAALLLIPLVGFLPAKDPRVVATVEGIQKHLSDGSFVRRYDTGHEADGLVPGEGAFLICSFWLADNLALMGRQKEAEEHFRNLLAVRNDVGLLAEEFDPASRRMLGNFPQAFSHVGLINTAHNLSPARGPAERRSRH